MSLVQDSCNSGISRRHGSHQVAQKLITKRVARHSQACGSAPFLTRQAPDPGIRSGTLRATGAAPVDRRAPGHGRRWLA